MEKIPQTNIESMEKKHPEFLKVFRFRHGSTQYTELNPDVPTDEFDLTEGGKQEIMEGVNAILTRLNKEKDVIVFTTSPRVRARGSMELARAIFEENGFTIWKSKDDTRLVRENMRAGDTLNKEGKPISKGKEGFADAQNRVMIQLTELLTPGIDASTAWASNPDIVSSLEKFNDVGERANKEVKLLFKIAHQIQSKTDKQIVVISFEHAETVDPLVSTFSGGAISQKIGNPLRKGEAVEMDISTKDYSMKVSLPLRKDVEEKVMNFSTNTNTFIKNENR